MSRLVTKEDRDLHGNAPCSFCGSINPSGVWRGEIFVHCCSSCARDVLPVLMADSTHKYSRASAFAFLRDVELAFWKAVAMCHLT
jgi:hypothetical protein